MNTNLSTTFEEPVANVNILLENTAMEILPNVTSNRAVVNIDLGKELKEATLELFDLNGKKVADVFQGNLPVGNSNIIFWEKELVGND